MSLASQLVNELRAGAGQAPRSIVVAQGPRIMQCQALQCDSLAVTLHSLTLETQELAGATVDQLKAASQDLAARVNYLLEPIAPIEADAEGCTVQMRSKPPAKDDDGRRYYELLLRRGGSAALTRYEKQPGQPRVQVPAALTHEVVGRLVDDFCMTMDTI